MTWMTGNLPARPAVTTIMLQPDEIQQAGDHEVTGDALWLIGGGVLALLALGFILTRRSRQRTAEPVFDHGRSGRFDDDEEYVEPLL
ncbi:hypothetical protein ACFL3X_00255 [Gemmatimonadota bacterium]